MTDAQILSKAIEKAQANGFELSSKKHAIAVQNDILGTPTGVILGYESIIFDHDFAKALWGVEQVDINNIRTICGPLECWEFHLREMVLEDNPIKYLEQFT